MRIGHGYDLHRYDLKSGSTEIHLGGVKVPYKHGVIAHSDGDVLIHALCDALLGAMALGDLGQHFPDSDSQWRDAEGANLLRRVAAMMSDSGWVLCNADLTLIAEAPRVGAYRDNMRGEIADALCVDIESISIKATTNEGCGAIGRGEALAAHAVVLLNRHDHSGD